MCILNSDADVRLDRLTLDDWQRYRTIRLSAMIDTPDAFASTHTKKAAFSSDRWQARLTGCSATFIAVVDNIDVGLISGAQWQDRDGFAGLFQMWVMPKARKKGVAGHLITAVIKWAYSSGFNALALDVADTNHAAIELYRRHGFEATGITGALPPPRSHITEHERVLKL